ncbi:MAG: molybdopterin-synthase adenylyltransferase MoeB [Verrucomicrobia bacterium]|nr:molybdopterin-synthase adenylyltransferase MoeB [Verrucomicrobiota bacterium]
MSLIPRITETTAAQELSSPEMRRYARHLIMPEVTVEGQRKLKAARVLAIGTGGLGSPLLAYLAAAGVGRLGIVDFDRVDESNLQRQIIHRQTSIGQAKVESARRTIAELNPHVDVVTHEIAMRSDNALDLLRDYDVVVDGTDNFPTRYLVNDACALLGKPNVYGSIFRFEGQCTVFWAGKGPCYRCLYPEPPPPGSVPSCAEGGVLGILPGVIGVLQAIETVKLILGIGDPLIGRLLLFDALKMRFKEMRLRQNPECPMCGTNKTITGLIDYEQFCGMPAREGPVQEGPKVPEISCTDLKKKIDSKKSFVLVDVREPHEFLISKISGSTLLPLSELPKRWKEIPQNKEVVILCKVGIRSAKALLFLQQQGYKNLLNLKGGIDAWSQEIDPSQPRY